VRFALTESRSLEIEDRIRRLKAIDVALEEAAKNSVAEGVGDLRLNYTKHLQTLKSEGSRLLREISALSGIPLKYDRYRTGSQATYSFRSDYG
jgi:hypothetical protein